MSRRAGKRMRQDESAKSGSSTLPAFLARPEGVPVYHGFPLVEETRKDGWVFGAISEYEDPKGCDWGDAFVVAPDGSRAGIVRAVDDLLDPHEICAPSEGRWGVYGFGYTKLIRTTSDFVEMCHSFLPELQRRYASLKSGT